MKYISLSTIIILLWVLSTNHSFSQLKVTPESLDFGELHCSQNIYNFYSLPLELRNTSSTATLYIENVWSSNGAGIFSSGFPLPPGATYVPAISVAWKGTDYDWYDTIHIYVRNQELNKIDTVNIPVSAAMRFKSTPFVNWYDAGVKKTCACFATDSDGKPVGAGGIAFVLNNPLDEPLRVDSIRIIEGATAAIIDTTSMVNYTKIATYDSVGMPPPSVQASVPFTILPTMAALMRVSFVIASEEGRKKLRVAFYTTTASGKSYTVEGIATKGTAYSEELVGISPFNNKSTKRVGVIDSTRLTFNVFKCSVPNNAPLTITRIGFAGQRANELSLYETTIVPLRLPPVYLPQCYNDFALTYGVRWKPTLVGATVDSIVVEGNYVVNEQGDQQPFRQTYALYLTALAATSVEDSEVKTESASVQVYPNPSSAVVTVVWISGVPTVSLGSLELFDVTGKSVLPQPVEVRNGIGATVNTSLLPAGNYTVRILSTNGKAVSEQVVIAP